MLSQDFKQVISASSDFRLSKNYQIPSNGYILGNICLEKIVYLFSTTAIQAQCCILLLAQVQGKKKLHYVDRTRMCFPFLCVYSISVSKN